MRVSADALDEGFGHWFAGFMDGEGCFDIYRKHHHDGRGGSKHTFGCRATLGLRADDQAILDEIRSKTGLGSVLGKKPYGRNTNPGYRWHCYTKLDCLTLVEIFDRFPLRAKKARDYAIWRRAVIAWQAVPPPRRGEAFDWAPFERFQDEIRAVRRFAPSDPIVLPPDEVIQLVLLDELGG